MPFQVADKFEAVEFWIWYYNFAQIVEKSVWVVNDHYIYIWWGIVCKNSALSFASCRKTQKFKSRHCLQGHQRINIFSSQLYSLHTKPKIVHMYA